MASFQSNVRHDENMLQSETWTINASYILYDFKLTLTSVNATVNIVIHTRLECFAMKFEYFIKQSSPINISPRKIIADTVTRNISSVVITGNIMAANITTNFISLNRIFQLVFICFSLTI